jgi:bisphosphoglycerate-dependent phosphoglycerate mutase family 1
MRHADCKGIKEGVINGWRDYPLTAKGRKEPIIAAKDIQMLLGTIKIDKVYTSYLVRTYDTGKIFANELNYKGKIVKDLRLNERHYGMFQGMKRLDAKSFPEYNTLSEKELDLENRLVPENDLRRCATLNEYSEKLKMPIKKLENVIPRSESILDVEKRLNEFLDEILVPANEKKTIVIVTHANPIKLIAKRMQNLTYKKTSELRFATCAQKIYDLRYSKQDGYEVIAEYNINKDMEG